MYFATDAVLELIYYSKKDPTTTTTAMMANIKTFDNVFIKKLIGVMRRMGLPETKVKWNNEFTKASW
jgi:hypothetical protein